MRVKPIKMRWKTGGVNYSYLLSTYDGKSSWIIDPAETSEVLNVLNNNELKSIKAVVNTHHHHDHSGGNISLINELRKYNVTPNVICGSHMSQNAMEIPTHLQKYELNHLTITCIRTPCHTQDSICYYVEDSRTDEKLLFTGDTLFVAGCGKFFEGDGIQMDDALNKRLLNVIGESNWHRTRIFPGHEYTRSNVAFIRKSIYQNSGENNALDKLELFCNKNEITTGCFTLMDELEYNPFMRLDDPIVRERIGDTSKSWTHSEVISKLREMKNNS